MKCNRQTILAVLMLAVLTIQVAWVSNTPTATASDSDKIGKPVTHLDRQIDKHAQRTVAEGRHIFRFDTFGDEAFWGDTIKLHQAIQGKRFG
ncbi:MAG TPA: hypothetical protein VFI43_04395, partial [Nitrosospira sp.]|nr:hypothetical protein [Nitrosospira sp.]